jgi:hypothetical protein
MAHRSQDPVGNAFNSGAQSVQIAGLPISWQMQHRGGNTASTMPSKQAFEKVLASGVQLIGILDLVTLAVYAINLPTARRDFVNGVANSAQVKRNVSALRFHVPLPHGRLQLK